MVICGGQLTLVTCVRLPTPGATEWEHYAFIESRSDHTSWWTSSGKLILLGGYVSTVDVEGGEYLATTEIVGDGTSPFTLEREAS